MLCSGGSRSAKEKTVSRPRDPWQVDNQVAVTVLGTWRGLYPCPRNIHIIEGDMDNEMGKYTVF